MDVASVVDNDSMLDLALEIYSQYILNIRMKVHVGTMERKF